MQALQLDTWRVLPSESPRQMQVLELIDLKVQLGRRR